MGYVWLFIMTIIMNHYFFVSKARHRLIMFTAIFKGLPQNGRKPSIQPPGFIVARLMCLFIL
jgi:hypothetical protein